MRIHLLLIILPLLLAAGCTTATSSSKAPAWTLEDNAKAPCKIIEEFYGAAQWNEIKKLKYDGYVEIRGTVLRDRTISLGKIIEAFPDDSRNERAKVFSRSIRLSPVSVGSHMSANASVFVFFYESNLKPRQALVVAVQDTPPTTLSYGGTIYMDIITY